LGFAFNRHEANSSVNIGLKITVPDKTYKLGQIVPVDIHIENKSPNPVYLSGEAVEGTLIQISFGNDNGFKNYVGPGRGFTVDGIWAPVKINPKEVFTKRSMILWNYKPDVSHLSVDVAKPFLEGRILTDYAFVKAGTYFIKCVLTIPGTKPDESSIRIESEPIEITI
jgi:hypothetical protein